MTPVTGSDAGISRVELRAALSLSSVYALRMLGLFLILPVFALYAVDLEGVTPALTGLAIGIYGITQALLQIPAGLLSDRIGRKPVIIGGLLLFAAGSLVAASAHSIHMIIAGRALQGAGAIAAAIMALLADLTREEHRIKAMAIIGMSIGAAFGLALVLGPVLNHWVGVPGIFTITAILALGAVLLVAFGVPTPQRVAVHREAEPVPAQFGRVLRNGRLLRLDASILLLHAILTATFVVIPLVLRDEAHISAAQHWLLYLPVLVVSVLLMVPFVILAERRGQVRVVLLGAIGLLGMVQFGLFAVPVSVLSVVALLIAFFTAINLLESVLPSLVSRMAPADCRGTAMGFYSSAQFFGAFLGGSVGGWLHGAYGLHSVFLACACAALLWLLLVFGLRPPVGLGSVIYRLRSSERNQIERATARLQALPGVREVVVVAEEGVAYLKVNRKEFDASTLA